MLSDDHIDFISNKNAQSINFNSNNNTNTEMKGFKKFDLVLPVLIEEEEKK